MASRHAKQLVRSTLTGVVVDYATVPSNHRWEVTEVQLVNSSASSTLVATISTGGVKWYSRSTTGGQWFHDTMFTVLEAGDKISIIGSTSLHILISGIDVSPAT